VSERRAAFNKARDLLTALAGAFEVSQWGRLVLVMRFTLWFESPEPNAPHC
jgi:hypothetical protein